VPGRGGSDQLLAGPAGAARDRRGSGIRTCSRSNPSSSRARTRSNRVIKNSHFLARPDFPVSSVRRHRGQGADAQSTAEAAGCVFQPALARLRGAPSPLGRLRWRAPAPFAIHDHRHMGGRRPGRAGPVTARYGFAGTPGSGSVVARERSHARDSGVSCRHATPVGRGTTDSWPGLGRWVSELAIARASLEHDHAAGCLVIGSLQAPPDGPATGCRSPSEMTMHRQRSKRSVMPHRRQVAGA